jgi:hypothetical protein
MQAKTERQFEYFQAIGMKARPDLWAVRSYLFKNGLMTRHQLA